MAGEDSRPPETGQSATDLQPGRVVAGTYEIVRPLGRGGMGAVWLARHLRLRGKQVAIKVLLDPAATGDAVARFAREAEIAARIGHPNIVDVLDFHHLPGGEPYIVLEFLQGETLRDRLRQGPLTLDATFAITRQIGSALHAAHCAGVVHRDLKPENVFLCPTDSGGVLRDHVKVLDFGISKLRGSQTLQTAEAVVLGTPQYMAPEQATGRNAEVDARSDLFALAAIVHELLCGQPPFVADTPLGVMFKVVYEPTPPLSPRMPQVPPRAVAAIEKGLAKAADARFPDVAAFIEALTGVPLQVLSGPPSVQADPSAAGWAATLDGNAAVGDTAPEWAETMSGSLGPEPKPADPGLEAALAAPTAAWTGPATASEPSQVFVVADDAPRPKPGPGARTARWIALGLAVAVTAGWLAMTRGAGGAAEPAAAAGATRSAPNQTAALGPTPAAASAPGAALALAPALAVAPAGGANPAPAPTPAPVAALAPAPVAAPLVDPVTAADPPPSPAPAAAPAVTPATNRRAALPAEVQDDLARARAALEGGRTREAIRWARHSLLGARTPEAFAILLRAHCAEADLGAARAALPHVRGRLRTEALRACRASGLDL